MCANREISCSFFGCLFINRKKAEEEERLRKEAEAEAAAQIAELDRQLKVRQRPALRNTPLFVPFKCLNLQTFSLKQ